MRSMINTCLSIGFAASAVLGVTLQAAEGASRFSFGVEAGMRWDDNIGLGPDDPAEFRPENNDGDQFDDLTTRISGTLNYNAVESGSQEFVLSATPFYELVNDLDDLSNYGLTVQAAYRGEFGSEFTDPWYSATVGYTIVEFDDSRIRDGDWFEAELAIGKRFSPAFGLSGGARYFTRSQDNSTGLCPDVPSGPECDPSWDSGEVFNHDKWGAFAHADFFVGDKTAFFVEYSYWDGDAASTGAFDVRRATGNGGAAENIFAEDPPFGVSYIAGNGVPRDYFVWRVEATQHIVEAGVSRELTDQLSIALTAIHLETSDVKGEKLVSVDPNLDNYRNDAVELTLTFDFR